MIRIFKVVSILVTVIMDRKDDNEDVIAEESRRNKSKGGLFGKFRGYIARDKSRSISESFAEENAVNTEVFETSDVDSDTVDARTSDIRHLEIKQETRQKQTGTNFEAENQSLEVKLEQVKAKFEGENHSLEAKFSQVFGELSERMRQQNIRVERGTKVNTLCDSINLVM